MRKYLTCLAFALGILSSSAQTTPLMGWASWNNYRVNISDQLIRNQADALVSSGLFAVGYNHINIDDGFFAGRNSTTNLLNIDAVKFPNGMKPVADYIHSKGLLAGIYSEGGKNTCGSIYDAQTGGLNVGLYGYEQQDIDMIFKDWGYNYLKIDWCGGQQQSLDEETQYNKIFNAVQNTGVPNIRLNLCRWQFPGTWAINKYGSWRISQDIRPTWASISEIIDLNAYLAAYASPGHYNDMDMLEVGRGLTADEDKSHFSMWCIMSSPLVLGADLTTIPPSTISVISNQEVIALNQDPAGLQAKLISNNGAGLQVWAKPLGSKQSAQRAVVLLNRTNATAVMNVNFNDLFLSGSVALRDLWAHTDLGSFTNSYSVSVPAHGCVTLKATGTQTFPQQVFEAEYAYLNNLGRTLNTAYIPTSSGRALINTNRTNSSGYANIGWLGNNANNWVEFKDVFAPTAGTYNLKLFYITSEDRTANVTVNGGAEVALPAPSTGGNLGSVSITVTLAQGVNTIRFSNPTGWMPDFDRIEIAFATTTQTITFNAISPTLTTVADFSPGASTNSNLPITYQSSDPTIAQIVNGKIHPVKAGVVTITAYQQGNGTYTPAASVSQVLTLTEPPLGLPTSLGPDSLKTFLNRTGWVGTASSAHSSGPVGNAINGNNKDFWSTTYGQTGDRYYTVDMLTAQNIDGVYIVQRYQNDPAPYTHGSNIIDVTILYSNDNSNWTPIITNYKGLKLGMAHESKQFIDFPSKVLARYYRILVNKTYREVNGDGDRTATIVETCSYTNSIPDYTVYTRKQWRLSAISDNVTLNQDLQDPGYRHSLIDYDNNTYWQSQWSGTVATYPHKIIVDMRATVDINKIYYVQRNTTNGRVFKGTIAVSTDSVTFTPVKTDFIFVQDNNKNVISFPKQTARYIMLSIAQNYYASSNPTSPTAANLNATSLAEIGAGYDSTLPVDLIKWEGKKVGYTSLLQWTVANEVNVSHYEVLRSTDGKTFKVVGKVNATEGQATKTLSLTDARPESGTNYYKLKSVDKDGTFSESTIISLHFLIQTGIKISPNPVVDELAVNVTKPTAVATLAKIYDVSGKLLLKKSVASGATNFDISMASLSAGIYILVFDDQKVKVIKK